MEEIEIYSEFIKLDQFLKFANVAASGGEAKQMVEDGIVFVNGVKAFEKRKKIYPGDVVEVKAEDIEIALKATAEKE